jgi:non-specific serine/threonine protein kinase
MIVSGWLSSMVLSDERTDRLPQEETGPGAPGQAPTGHQPAASPNLAGRLRHLRLRAGKSQRQLAELAGIDVTYLSKLENGRQGGSERVLRLLADALGISAADLLVPAGRIPAEGGTALASDPAADLRPVHPPRFATRFVNREDQFANYERVRRPGAIITITGPPGCGKSRFAAELVVKGNGDGETTWVTVRAGDDAARIDNEVAAGDTGPGSVVVLDDADLALEACADVARRLVRNRPGAVVLATSREPLRLYGEQMLPLAGLAVPDRHLRPDLSAGGARPDLSRFLNQESVSLFIDRARLVVPAFELDRTNAGPVFDVCRGLDGLPLAIELAALRLRQMTVVDLAAELDTPFEWLAGTIADVPERHASFEAAIAWSFDRLTPEQRSVATRLSLFTAPFRRTEAAEVARDDETLRPERVRDVVLELVDRSLLLREADYDGKAVYRWPHPIRQYARRELDAGPDAARAREQYGKWCRRVIESLKDDPPRSEAQWARFVDLTPDLYAVTYNLPDEEQQEAVTRLTGARSIVLQFGSGDSQWFVDQLLHSKNARSQASIFREAGILARVQGDFAVADQHLRDALQIAVSQRDLQAQADALHDLAENEHDRGDLDTATDNLKRAEEIYRELDDRRGIAEAENLLGRIRLSGPDPDSAEPLFRDALELARQKEDRRLEAYALQNLGHVDRKMGRAASARIHLQESLTMRFGIANLRGAARVVETLAMVESDVGNHGMALQLIGAARQYRTGARVTGMASYFQAQIERVEEEARTALAATPGEVERSLRLGANLSLEEAGELAQRGTDAPLRGPLGDPVSGPPLRRRLPADHRVVAPRADAAPEGGRRDGSAQLATAIAELAAGKGTASEVQRRLRAAEVLALGEPTGTAVDDVVAFAVDPFGHRGMIVPVFTRFAALTGVLRRRPEWASRPVVSIRADRLQAALLPGEVVVVDPWLPTEYRFSRTEQGYLASQPDDEEEAAGAEPAERGAA